MSDDPDDEISFAQRLMDGAPPYVACVVTLLLMETGEAVACGPLPRMKMRTFVNNGSIATRSGRVDPCFQAAANVLREMADQYDRAFTEAGFVNVSVTSLDPEPGEPSS